MNSVNCVREFLRAVHNHTPIIAVFETDLKHGGVQIEDLLTDLEGTVASLRRWGLDTELACPTV